MITNWDHATIGQRELRRKKLRDEAVMRALQSVVHTERSLNCAEFCEEPFDREHPTCSAERAGSATDTLYGCLCPCHDERLAALAEKAS